MMTNIYSCIKLLEEKPSWFFDKDKTAEKMQCLDAIQQTGSTYDIYHLIAFLKHSNPLIREKCADVILHLFGRLDSMNSYVDTLKHLRISSADLDLYKEYFDKKVYIQLLGIASLNGSGFVREKAIKELTQLKDTGGLKFILIRLGDWVLPVRKAAAEALVAYLDVIYVDSLLQQLTTINWLLEVRRTDLTTVHSHIMKFIVSHEFSAEFHNKIKHLSDKARLIFYLGLFEHTSPEKHQVNIIMKDRSFLVRLEVLKRCAQFEQAFQKELIAAFLHDQSARIRMNALYLSKLYAPDFDNDILALSSDRSASVRELCRQLLKSKGFDFTEIYRERIQQEIFLAGSLMGLAETGSLTDLPIFEQHIHSQKSGIVICCLGAISKYDPDKGVDHSLALLTHPTGRVRNKAGEILAKGCNIKTLEQIRMVYATGDDEIKRTVLKLYDMIGGWNVLSDLLVSLSDENSRIQTQGWQLLEKWKNRVVNLFTTPVKAEMEKAAAIYNGLDRDILTDKRKKLLDGLAYCFK